MATVEIALAREPPADDEVGLFGVANVLLRRWTLVAGLPLLAALLAGAVSLLVPPTFTATTSFVPEVRPQSRLPAGLGGLTGIAGQLGISLGADANQSPRFYADVVKSQALRFVPSLNLPRCAHALASVSCTRSSARSGSRARDLANARSRGSSGINPLRKGVDNLGRATCGTVLANLTTTATALRSCRTLR